MTQYVTLERWTGESTVLRRRFPDLLLALGALSYELEAVPGGAERMASLRELRLEDLPFETAVGSARWRVSPDALVS